MDKSGHWRDSTDGPLMGRLRRWCVWLAMWLATAIGCGRLHDGDTPVGRSARLQAQLPPGSGAKDFELHRIVGTGSFGQVWRGWRSHHCCEPSFPLLQSQSWNRGVAGRVGLVLHASTASLRVRQTRLPSLLTQVRLATHKQTGMAVAIKSMSKASIQQCGQVQHVISERNLLRAVRLKSVNIAYLAQV